GEASVSYHGRADGPDGGPAVTPSALRRICHTQAKKPYEFIRTLARITLPMQLNELIHPNRHKTHYATPFPIVKTDARPPTIHARFLPVQFLRVTNLSARFREQDRNGGLGLGGRKNADGRARQSKRRWKELE